MILSVNKGEIRIKGLNISAIEVIIAYSSEKSGTPFYFIHKIRWKGFEGKFVQAVFKRLF